MPGGLVFPMVSKRACTILNEHGWDPELIEIALAHVDKDKVRNACCRANYIEHRRPEMAGGVSMSRKQSLEACRHLPPIKPGCGRFDEPICTPKPLQFRYSPKKFTPSCFTRRLVLSERELLRQPSG